MERIHILFVNLGTPDSYDLDSLRKYLSEFLMDPYVINLPYLLRFILVQGIIVPFRPYKIQKAYEEIWDKTHGSPLIYHSNQFLAKIKKSLPKNVDASIAMRYGNPSIESALRLVDTHCDNLIVMPLFPQFADAVVTTAVEKVKQVIHKLRLPFNVSYIPPFYQEDFFIKSQKLLLSNYIESFKPDCMVASYHGLPVNQLVKSGCKNAYSCQNKECPDSVLNSMCYRQQCYATSRALHPELYTAFQSRIGLQKWTLPNVEDFILELLKKNKKRLLVISPSFVADCLETVEELGMRLRDDWLSNGGEDFCLVPCLNSNDNWVNNLVENKLRNIL